MVSIHTVTRAMAQIPRKQSVCLGDLTVCRATPIHNTAVSLGTSLQYSVRHCVRCLCWGLNLVISARKVWANQTNPVRLVGSVSCSELDPFQLYFWLQAYMLHRNPARDQAFLGTLLIHTCACPGTSSPRLQSMVPGWKARYFAVSPHATAIEYNGQSKEQDDCWGRR